MSLELEPNEQEVNLEEINPQATEQTVSPRPVEQSISPEPPEPQKNKQNPILIGVLIVAIIALVFAIFWVLRGNSGDNNDGGATILPTATIVVSTPEPGQPVATVTAADGVNIRSGPGTDYEAIGILPFGASAPVIGRSADGQWWVLDIRAAPNGQGWVSAGLVAVENAGSVPVILPPDRPAPAPTETPVPEETPVVTILFDVDNTPINQGECTTLRWKVDNVREVYVYPVGESWNDYPQAGSGSEQVCPTETTAYEMRVVLQNNSIDQRQLTVEVISDDPLANTSWTLAFMNVTQPTIPGVAITAIFDDAGGLGGNAGCNTYNGPYTVTGNQLAAGPLIAGRVSCAEDVNAQEQAYLTALQSAATFTINGGQLVIYDASGTEALRYR